MRNVFAIAVFCAALPAYGAETVKIKIDVDRGADRGQSFGSLFEAVSADGSLVLGAGFQNAYNTRYRADRHAVQFFIRPVNGKRQFTAEELPRPSQLCGAYLFGRDGTVYSTYGGLKTWRETTGAWRNVAGSGGTHETMRVGNGTLAFGDSRVAFDGKAILDPPSIGSYQLFFYANGHLCFYHVNRGDRGYRPFENEEDGFSRLYACPWTPEQPTVDLASAVTMRLPVVGETTFAWGQLGKQIVTGSNIGGFYIFEESQWRKILEPELGRSYQLYSTLAFHDRLLMGQYPTGRVFEFDGEKITDLKGWPPVLPGVSGSAREAQTTAIYGGELLVGVWPWGELWRYSPDRREWSFVQRMFDHPALSKKIVHPYDIENAGNAVGNLWGQRVTSLVSNGPNLFVSTSAKSPFEFDAAKFKFLAPDKWKSYGKVYRLASPGHLAAPTKWTDGPTTIEFKLGGNEMAILQDGRRFAATILPASLAKRFEGAKPIKNVRWGNGVFGRFGGVSIKGTVATSR